jgi:hypothetical protein
VSVEVGCEYKNLCICVAARMPAACDSLTTRNAEKNHFGEHGCELGKHTQGFVEHILAFIHVLCWTLLPVGEVLGKKRPRKIRKGSLYELERFRKLTRES